MQLSRHVVDRPTSRPISGRPVELNRCSRLFRSPALLDGEDPREQRLDALPKDDHCEPVQLPTVLLAEHRDEVFARLSTDMTEAGLRVIRAMSATEALKLCGTYEPAMVVANLDLPDQSGWLLAVKLRFAAGRIRVWLYQSQRSRYHEGMARYLQVDALFDYGGDLLRLSETIVGLIDHRAGSSSAAFDTRQAAQLAAA